MRNYKYYSDVIKNAIFTEEPCHFCGSKVDCLEGIYFESTLENVEFESICLICLEKGRIHQRVPRSISILLKDRVVEKIAEMSITPPVPWIQNNEWPVCCDDFMTYIGEWNRDDFDAEAPDGNGLKYMKYLMGNNAEDLVNDFEVLWDDIANYTAAFTFECQCCKNKTVVCQDY